MKKKFLAVLVAALSVGAAQGASPLYTMRVPSKGLLPAVAHPTASAVGDGVSKSGACASGAATACAYWGAASYNTTISNSNLSATLNQNTTSSAVGSVLKSSGKWYWEMTFNASSAGSAPLMGVVSGGASTAGSVWTSYYSSLYAIYNGTVGCASPWFTPVMSGSQWSPVKGDTYGVAVDLDAHTLTWYHSGAVVGVACTNLPTSIRPIATYGNAANTPVQIDANFGQADFKYPVPVGYNAGLW